MMSKLSYVGQKVADHLAENIRHNLELYKTGDFRDMANKGDWNIRLSIDADTSVLENLQASRASEAEINNSLAVGEALRTLTPSMARENRIWIRLSHIEGLEYARARWLENVEESKLEDLVRIHFFAPTWTRCRDDHAIARLWWNHKIASMLMPEDPKFALSFILSRADIRSNFVERARIGARIPVGRGIIRALATTSELRTSEILFREFMKTVNLQGAGKAFEVFSEQKVDTFMKECVDRCLTDMSLMPSSGR